ncbi:hypothetical protein MHYP_G00309690 [Metynnis hypsauchen]
MSTQPEGSRGESASHRANNERSTAAESTGYGPRHVPGTAMHGRGLPPRFDGDEARYHIWEARFSAYLKTIGLKDAVLGSELAGEANAAEDEEICRKNELAYAELCGCLDDNTLTLIVYEAPDDGKKSLAILRRHFESEEKPRIVGLYTELTNVLMADGEALADYLARVEKIVAALKRAKETLSDALLIAMVLKGLTDDYSPFSVHVTQTKETLTFNEFKARLRSFECTLRYCSRPRTDEVMTANFRDSRPKLKEKERKYLNGECFICEKMGHRAKDCRNKDRKTQRKVANKQNSNKVAITADAEQRTFCVKERHESINKEETFVLRVSEWQPHETQQQGLLVDSGASAHIITDENAFIRFDETFQPKNHVMQLADGTRITGSVLKRWNAQFELTDCNRKVARVKLTDALLIPGYPQNILSVDAAASKGARFNFEKNNNKMVLPDGTMCKMKHEVMGHCNYDDLVKLETVVNGMKIKGKTNRPNQCEICLEGKFTQSRNRQSDVRAKEPLELVHTDLGCPIAPESFEGYKYAITFTDDFSGAIYVYFLRNKNKAVEATKQFLADTAPYGKVKRLRSDNGTEFVSEEYQSLLRDNAIKHERSAPYSPHQNGTAERNWRTVFEMVRCMLIESGLPKELWPYAARTAAVIRNRCYCKRTGETPYFLFTGKRPDLSKMKKFGSECMVYEQNKKKLDPKGKKGIFVGFDRHSPAYMVYFPETNKVQKHRLVHFIGRIVTERQTQTDRDQPEDHFIEWVTTPSQTSQSLTEETKQTDTEIKRDSELESDTDPTTDAQTIRTTGRVRKKPKYLENYECAAQSSELNIDYCYRATVGLPQTYKEAVTSPVANRWKKDMREEMSTFRENNTFSLVPLPEGRRTVGGRWVYALKEDDKGNETYKARYVAKGYSQVQGLDYSETFSPTANLTSLRVLIQLAAQHDLTLNQMDVKAAYLHAPIDYEIYMDQPEGFQVKSEDGVQFVCKLNKSIYGLKQSGRNWNMMLHEFVQSQADHCIYTKLSDKGKVILLVWVDDIVVAASNEMCLREVKEKLKSKFKMKDLGHLTHFIGIDFTQKDGSIKMNQSKYIKDILKRFGMAECKTRATPSELKCDLTPDGEQTDQRKYREMLGSLNYIMTCTRPDISWIVSKLSQHMSDPREKHMTALKHVYRYLQGTVNYELSYEKCDNKLELMGYSDADWANDILDRKSTTGYCFSLSQNVAVVSWKTRKQQTVSLSTCEAEYVALAATIQEALYLSQLLQGMDHTFEQTVRVFEDNQGTIRLAKNPVNRQRSKHVDIKYHFIRSNILQGKIVLVYCPTENMVADVFTKSATRAKIEKFCSYMFGN